MSTWGQTMLNQFSISLVTDAIDDETEAKLLDELADVDGSVTVQAGLTTVDALLTAQTAAAAAIQVIPRVESLGVRVDRLMLELATQAQIAREANVSRQTVSNWAQDRAGQQFPAPYALTGSGPVWVWDEVNEWLRRTGRSFQSWRTSVPEDVSATSAYLRRRHGPQESAVWAYTKVGPKSADYSHAIKAASAARGIVLAGGLMRGVRVSRKVKAVAETSPENWVWDAEEAATTEASWNAIVRSTHRDRV